jgi:hypothetical protein
MGCTGPIGVIAKAWEGGDQEQGKTFYLGGAGPVGNVGSWDVPAGLSEGGYTGRVEVFPWQGMTHVGDQINLSRNREKAIELANRIMEYRRHHEDQQINIIALSAGTGVSTFALEYLPEGVNINKVIYLGCSMSSQYDLTRMLKRISGGLYVLNSPYDRILRDVVWYTGTVDKHDASEGVAGLQGFRPPGRAGPDTEVQYTKVHNVEYRDEFSLTGYEGAHTDSTKREFVRKYLAPVILGNDRPLLGRRFEEESTTRPAMHVNGTRAGEPQPKKGRPRSDSPADRASD